MRTWITAGLAALVVVLAPGGSASAAPPLRDRFDVDGSFQSDQLTAACGFPVEMTLTGRFSIAVWATHEIDTYPGAKVTYSSESGRSITIPFSGILHASYPQGIFIGAPAIVALTGNDGPFGVTEPGSGRLVFSTVIGEINDGVPGTRLIDLISQSGNFTGQTQRICTALA